MSFTIKDPSQPIVPILVSVPHASSTIPNQMINQYRPKMITQIDDTDWFVDQLYDFVGSLGIKMIVANYSRWVIDLNRPANNIPLYNDGRVITSLCPSTNFNDEPIYIGELLSSKEINRRKSVYYYPYYDQIRIELTKLQRLFKHVLFFDAHSIRQYVPGIRATKFPDLILGDVDGQAADSKIIQSATSILSASKWSFDYNHPFKGGSLTRTFGQPDKHIHALQLEMSKPLYMDDSETKYHYDRANTIQQTLQSMFENLINTLDEMNQE